MSGKKTEETTSITLVPVNFQVSFNIRTSCTLEFIGPMPNDPFPAPGPTPFPTSYGIQFIPRLVQFFPIKPGDPESSSDKKDPRNESIGSKTSHYDIINHCGSKTMSECTNNRHIFKANESGHENEVSKSSSMPHLMENIACGEQTLVSQTSNELSKQQTSNKKDLPNFINLGIVYFRFVNEKIRKALSMVKKTHRSGIQKLTKKLKELKANNAKFVKTLHNLQMECNNVSTEELAERPEVMILKEYADKIIHNYNQITYGTLKNFLPSENISVRPEHLLCSLLGLKLSVADCLIDINPEMRCHQDDSYWIIKYLEKNEPTSYSDHVERDLASIGFTDERAEYLSLCLKSHQFESHISLLDWAIRYIEGVFKYDILLNQRYNGDPLPGKVGQVQVMRIKENEGDTNSEENSNNVIKGLKLNSENDQQNTIIQTYLIDQGTNFQGVRYWFHGTDYDSAWSIVEKGIRLEGYGKKCGDFSDGNGFYLTSNFQFAKAWPVNFMKKSTCAVIVFTVDDPKDMFNDYKGLELSEDQEWKDIVTYYRNGSHFNGSERKRLAMESNRRYIYGPLSKDGNKCKSGENWTPSVRYWSCERKKIPYMQLCVKDSFLAADIFDFSSIFVIFFT